MNTTLNHSIEPVIFDLKHSIDDIWEKYGDSCLLDSLAYAEREYGHMQRTELQQIIGGLASLKMQVDSLLEDSLKIPEKFRRSHDAAQKNSAVGKISLIEMLEALNP